MNWYWCYRCGRSTARETPGVCTCGTALARQDPPPAPSRRATLAPDPHEPMGPTITINYYTGDGQLKWISHARNFVHFTAEGVVITEEDKGRVLLWCEIAKVQAAS